MRLEGHEPYDAVVEVGDDTTGVHAKLKSRFGRVSLVAPAAKKVGVWVDGESWGTTPVQNRQLPPGRHLVEIRDRRYRRTTVALRINAGEQRQVVLRPMPIPTPAPPSSGGSESPGEAGFDRIFEMPEDN